MTRRNSTLAGISIVLEKIAADRLCRPQNSGPNHLTIQFPAPCFVPRRPSPSRTLTGQKGVNGQTLMHKHKTQSSSQAGG